MKVIFEKEEDEIECEEKKEENKIERKRKKNIGLKSLIKKKR